MKLLNPGPVTLTARVRNALLREDMCHREEDFAALTRSVIERLARVYPDAEATHTPVLLTGSGTAAVESMVTSLVPKDARVLVVANGVYGERAASMLLASGQRHVHTIRAEWLEPMRVDEAERALDSGEYGYCVAVHHETTTGRLNDLDRLGAACKRSGAALLLDTVSSFGGEDIRFDAWNLLACAATANKCLHGVPGVAFVLARTDALTNGKSAASSVYLDLYRYFAEQRRGFSPFTPAVQAMFALDEALSELADGGGVAERHATYVARTALVMDGLRGMNIPLLLESPAAYSSILTSYRLPPRLPYERLHDELKRAGFVIYAGQGKFQGAIFRVAVMGDVATIDLERLLGEIRRIAS